MVAMDWCLSSFDVLGLIWVTLLFRVFEAGFVFSVSCQLWGWHFLLTLRVVGLDHFHLNQLSTERKVAGLY